MNNLDIRDWVKEAMEGMDSEELNMKQCDVPKTELKERYMFSKDKDGYEY